MQFNSRFVFYLVSHFMWWAQPVRVNRSFAFFDMTIKYRSRLQKDWNYFRSFSATNALLSKFTLTTMAKKIALLVLLFSLVNAKFTPFHHEASSSIVRNLYVQPHTNTQAIYDVLIALRKSPEVVDAYCPSVQCATIGEPCSIVVVNNSYSLHPYCKYILLLWPWCTLDVILAGTARRTFLVVCVLLLLKLTPIVPLLLFVYLYLL